MALLRLAALAGAALGGVAAPNATAAARDMPSFPLHNAAEPGLEFPAIGFGTGAYGSEPRCDARPGCMGISPGCGQCAYDSVLAWLRSGGRRLDLAHSYNNDAVVGRAIVDSGVPRSEIFILSKVSLGFDDAVSQTANILRDLGTDYLDALLIHWPTRGGTGFDPLCNPPVQHRECRISTWRALVELHRLGHVRSIGVSNYYREEMQEIIDAGMPLPTLNQCPFHLYRSSSQDDIREFCEEHDIHFNGYSPYAVPDFFDFTDVPGMSPTSLQDPRPVAIATRLSVTPAQVLLAWQIRLGVSVNPRSISAQHQIDAVDALAVVPQLTDDDLASLGAAPQIWCSVVPGNYQCAPDPEASGVGVQAPRATTDIYLATTGDDGHDGSSAAKALKTVHAAQAAVRKALVGATNSDVIVNIGTGEYVFDKPLTLTTADSGGKGSTVAWKAAASSPADGPPAPVAPVTWSGGQKVKFAAAADGVWKADVSALPAQAVALGRQLYVNDRRAARSTEPGSYDCESSPTDPCTKSKTVWGDKAWAITNTSIHIVDAQAAARAKAWPNGGAGVEFVWSGVGNAAWAESRCQVQAVVPADNYETGAVEVKMSPLCLACWASFKGQWQRHDVAAPTAIEAVGKDKLQPGEWWLDRVAKVIYYKPLVGESAAAAVAVVPVLEVVLEGSKLSDVTFSGISFQHATWFAPEGFVENQSGDAACAGFFGPITKDSIDQRLPANVRMFNTERVTFDRCEFAHLGANALDFAHGAHDNLVQDCLFRDVSAAALQIGRTSTAKVTDPAAQDIGNTVSNSIVSNPAVEYHGSMGISVGYTIGTNLSHNDVGNCTYGPISVGWGWGAVSYAANNTVVGNVAHDYKLLLNDGGCIYTLSPQPGNLIAENWCHSQGTPSSGALYPDEGSAYMTWRDNVVSNIGTSKWAHIWTGSIHDLVFAGNYHDTAKIENNGKNITMDNNTLMKPGVFPPKAKALMAAAGPKDSPWPRSSYER